MPESSAHLSLKVDGLGALASLVRALVLAQHNDLNNVVELVHGVEVGVERRRLNQTAVCHFVPGHPPRAFCHQYLAAFSGQDQ